jgi:hypothetical protein
MTVIILEAGNEHLNKCGRDYVWGTRHGVVGIDRSLGKAIEALVAERDAAIKRVAELEGK